MPDQQSTQLLLDQDLQPQKVLSTAATTVNNTLSKQSQELASIIQAEHLAGCDPQFGPCETLSLESLEMETKAVLECDPRLSRGSNHSISILNRVIGEFQSKRFSGVSQLEDKAEAKKSNTSNSAESVRLVPQIKIWPAT